jgi:hypothetical protein
MLKFLNNDFTQDRWKTAALKNAYALLSKNRYGTSSTLRYYTVLMIEYAAAFFMLADQPKDAISVCLRQMGDWQLAIALAKANEPDSNGPLLKWILTDRVVPMAFEGGHRWLASWAFWTLGRRDLSVRVLIVCLCSLVYLKALLMTRHPFRRSHLPGHLRPNWQSVYRRMMIRVYSSCFNTLNRNQCRLPREPVRSLPSSNSISCFTTQGYSSEWVR